MTTTHKIQISISKKWEKKKIKTSRNAGVEEEEAGEDDEPGFDSVLFFSDSEAQRGAGEVCLPTTGPPDPSADTVIWSP